MQIKAVKTDQELYEKKKIQIRDQIVNGKGNNSGYLFDFIDYQCKCRQWKFNVSENLDKCFIEILININKGIKIKAVIDVNEQQNLLKIQIISDKLEYSRITEDEIVCMNQILNQKNNLLQLSVDISKVKKVKIQVTVCIGSEINWVLNFIKSFDACIGAAYIIAEFFSQEIQDSTSSNNLNKYYNLSYNFKQICKRYDEQLNNFCQFVGIPKNIL